VKEDGRVFLYAMGVFASYGAMVVAKGDSARSAGTEVKDITIED